MTSWRKSVSPYSGGTVPDLHRSSLTVRRFVWRDPSIDLVAGLAIAVDLDAVLADTRPVWDAWLEDASRRARVELAVPADREEAATILDAELGDWRPLLDRFAADRAPLWFKPRADTNAVLRRLSAAGRRIGAFTDAPHTLAELGDDATVVVLREELAALR